MGTEMEKSQGRQSPGERGGRWMKGPPMEGRIPKEHPSPLRHPALHVCNTQLQSLTKRNDSCGSRFWRWKSVIFRPVSKQAITTKYYGVKIVNSEQRSERRMGSQQFPLNTHHNDLKIFQKVLLLPQGPQSPVAPCWVASLYLKGLLGPLRSNCLHFLPMREV